MGKKKCIICSNVSKPLFEFPSETSVRSIWFEAVARFCDISKITDYSVLCKNHFEERHCKNHNNTFRLTKGAVPIVSDTSLHVEFDNPADDLNIVEINSKSVQVDSISLNEIKDLQYHNKTLLLKLKRLQEKYSESLLKIKHLEETENQNSAKLNLVSKIFKDAENSDDQATFLADLIKNYGKKSNASRWSEISVRMCTIWRFRSAKGYEHCRSHLVQLPSKATLSRYLCQFNGPNELCKQRLLAEAAILKVPIERVCSLIDDMSVKEKIHYSRSEDQVYGLDDTKSTIIGEKPQVANKMLCYVIQGLSTKFTIPAGYFFHAALTADNFLSLTLKILNLLTECGFIVLRLVTDNHPSNVALFSRLSGGTPRNYIHHPTLKQIPLFLSFDYCHALKNARNLFLDHDLYSSNGIISSFLKILYDLQKGMPVKPVKYLTKKHLYTTNFDKMNVLRAIQVFSPAVTASLSFLKEERNENFSNVDVTICYMKNMYHFFQVHNVSNRIHYYRSLDSSVAPYVDVSDERLHWLEETFPNYIDDIQQSSASAGMHGLSKETAHALKFTARSTCLCIKFLLQQVGFYYVLTRSFSSDAVEAMFSHVRLKGGSNDTTYARTAEYALRQILRCGIVKASAFANIAETIEYTSSAHLTHPECDMTQTKEELLLPIHLRIQMQNLRLEIIPDNSIYSASVAFLAGYIIKKIDDKFHCNVCLEQLLSFIIPGPLLQLIMLQDRGNLKYPNTKFVGIIKQLADIIYEILPFLEYRKACCQLVTVLCPHLQHNSIFVCLDHRNAICEMIVEGVAKPILDNFCGEKTDLLKKKSLDFKPTSRKVLKL